jgi:hypothetical protein
MGEVREGGCLCGAVRYTAEWPPMMIATCSCKNCQRQAGSSVALLAVMPAEAVAITGVLTAYEDTGESGGKVIRKFCGTCGSPIVSEIPAAPQMIIVKAGTLDSAKDLAPTLHYWTSSAHDWVQFPEGGVMLEKQA